MPQATNSTALNSLSFGFIILLGALSALAAISTDIYLPATASMAESLSATQEQVQLTLGIFFLAYGFGQLLFGPLSDSLGRRPVLLAGLYIYTVSSLLCALSTDIDFLIINRLLQALGGCAAAVTSRAIIRDCTQGAETAKALAGVMSVIQVGPLIAPTLGGLILYFGPWPATFYTLSIYGLICIVAAHLWIKESHPKQKRQSLHPFNIAKGYLETFLNKYVMLLLFAEISASISLLTFVTGSALIFSQYYALSAQHYGLLFSLMASGILAGSWLSKHYVAKIGTHIIIVSGLLVALCSSSLLLYLTRYNPENLPAIVVTLWFCLLPCGAIRPNYVALGLQYLPNRTGTLSALFGAFSLGMGGVTAIVIGGFAQYTPLIMAIMIALGFASSTAFYLLWRVVDNPSQP
ncbi:multidrug effflux MFS transporter [Dasania marina]|uniref:multidrug effflux MFS transporter n=1 Tax=Dasania marina TaxID=471499 RepID=UPI0030DB509F|tara:strand:- start:82438 stop:83658 length:1221 start_codon:yes stop_codon:yes gene_type:complete